MMKVKTYLPLKIFAATAIILTIIYLILMVVGCHFIINPSTSLPRGVYFVKYGKPRELHINDYVEMRVPEDFKPYLYGRGWLTAGMTLLKQVGGLPGDNYCIYSDYFTINDIKIANVFEKDKFGYPLPVTLGCKIINQGDFFPLATNHEHSFDGRYMGAVKQEQIIGKATPIWIF